MCLERKKIVRKSRAPQAVEGRHCNRGTGVEPVCLPHREPDLHRLGI